MSTVSDRDAARAQQIANRWWSTSPATWEIAGDAMRQELVIAIQQALTEARGSQGLPDGETQTFGGTYDAPPHCRVDYQEVWRSGFRAAREAEPSQIEPKTLLVWIENHLSALRDRFGDREPSQIEPKTLRHILRAEMIRDAALAVEAQLTAAQREIERYRQDAAGARNNRDGWIVIATDALQELKKEREKLDEEYRQRLEALRAHHRGEGGASIWPEGFSMSTVSDRDAARAQQIARWFPPRACNCVVMEDRCAACAPLAEAVEQALAEVRAAFARLQAERDDGAEHTDRRAMGGGP
jgi:hypothetical protein